MQPALYLALILAASISACGSATSCSRWWTGLIGESRTAQLPLVAPYIYGQPSSAAVLFLPLLSIHDQLTLFSHKDSHSLAEHPKNESISFLNTSSITPTVFKNKHSTVKMQFNVLALTVAAMAAVASAQE
jgi:hypothetical protein